MSLLDFRRKLKKIDVLAEWDSEAKVWTATSNDVPGLVTEADTLDELAEKLKVMIPEMLEANDIPHIGGIPFSMRSELEAVAL
ncbi:MAG: DUF1902 domain-containing protein [Pyrinomonadaceae bacterium]|nr:DUF1902 domain-containing protein [Pyrinomonadaceae bacterium]